MKQQIIFTLFLTLFFFGCAPKPVALLDGYPNTLMSPDTTDSTKGYEHEDFDELLINFKNNCISSKAKKIYESTCKLAQQSRDAKLFFSENFSLHKIEPTQEKPILTGYYEPLLHGSLEKDSVYKYPLYSRPNDLLHVDLSSLFPELKNRRVRGRLVGNKVVPYFSRAEIDSKKLDSEIICYVDNKIKRFFLEVQGSGRVMLKSGETIFVGYSDQNGHPYHSIGRDLIKSGAVAKEDISLQSITKYLNENPQEVDAILNSNASNVFFKERKKAATGAMGLVLTPERSVAIDRRYIPLGAMLFVQSDSEDYSVSQFVFAQDTGGAIRGAVRADMFMGYGDTAEAIAGNLKSPLEVWIMLPKNSF
ncbi:MAG: MltA domain-containing protein [Campylobacterota bacterium]|nr:MltA domain-containing protein [Campylobacterota bacterium]